MLPPDVHGAVGRGEGRREEGSRPHEHFLFGLHERGAGDVSSPLVAADEQGHFHQAVALRLQKKEKKRVRKKKKRKLKVEICIFQVS